MGSPPSPSAFYIHWHKVSIQFKDILNEYCEYSYEHSMPRYQHLMNLIIVNIV